MQLEVLLKPLLHYRAHAFHNVNVEHITTDSRKVVPGTLFVAVVGHTVDGHDYAQQALEKGAVALLVERVIEGVDITQIIVKHTGHVAAMLADKLYAHPSTALRTIGVTGTNGKTTVTHMIRHVLESTGQKTGLIGTVGAVVDNQAIPLANTTPEAVDVHAYLAKMRDAKSSHAVMEVSSHALVEGRVAGVAYDVAVFTNLSQDHLDFHHTMEQYAHAKSLLFSRLGNTFSGQKSSSSVGIVNMDDKVAPLMIEATTMPVLTYGLQEAADLFATNLQMSHRGSQFDVVSPFGRLHIKTGLIGRFNVYNALAAIAVALVEGVEIRQIESALESYAGVPGRLERIDEGQSFSIFVDYAHTPDGLQNVLSSVREFAEGQVICVVGCGGDRDRTKRPLMAQTAVQFSDLTILTSDNPRTEDPEGIIDDMEEGLSPEDAYVRISDRRGAIGEAVKRASANDVIVIAGKGHEDYQIIGRTKIHFDDREEARAAVQARLTEE